MKNSRTMRIERIARRTKVRRGIYIVPMWSKNYKKVFASDGGMKFIFLGGGLTRRQRGGQIRRGFRFFKRMKEQNDEKK